MKHGLSARIELARGKKFQLRVELAANPGITVICGPSGGGKSTTLNCIAGLIKPDDGHVTFEEQALFDSKQKINLIPQHRNVGYVFQQGFLFPHLTAAQNIAFGVKGTEQSAKQQHVLELAKQLRISHVLEQMPSELSGGEAQRVAIARAIARSPKLLLLDEPFSALDEKLRSELGEQIKQLQAEHGMTILLITHSLSEAERLADSIVELDNGKSSPGKIRETGKD